MTRIWPMIAALALLGCEPAPDPSVPLVALDTDSLTTALRGRTLQRVDGAVEFTLRRNGNITGNGIEGRWQVQDGKFCSIITQPEELVSNQCQTVVFLGSQVTFFSQVGPNTTWNLL